MPTDAGAVWRTIWPGLPRRLRSVSLSRRLALGFLIITAVGVIAADVYCALALAHRLHLRTDQQIIRNQNFRLESLRECDDLAPTADGSATMIVDRWGRVLRFTGSSQITDALSLPAEDLRMYSGTGSPVAVGSEPFRAMVDELPGQTYLVTAQSTAEDTATVKTLVGIEAAISLPLIGMMVLGTLWTSLRTLTPIREVTRSARRLAELGGDLSRRILVTKPVLVEAQCTADVFNAMLRRIEEEAVRRRESEIGLCELVGAASHELRTPLTTITGYAQLARFGALDDPDQLDLAMERVQRETRRMSCLVDEMLLLARLGQGALLERRTVDLAKLCVAAVTEAQPCAPQRTFRYVVDSCAHLVEGDPGRLQQVVANLLANVDAHTPADAAAEVRLRRDGDHQIIDVIDEGPGIPEQMRKRVFEPFFRAEVNAPRGRDPDANSGSGLGLSVVAAVVGAHGGSVTVKPSERGSWIEIRLPALSSGAPAHHED